MKKAFGLKPVWLLFLAVIIIGLFFPSATDAASLKTSYPRLANYFLKWEVSDSETQELSKWDLLILDMEVAENSRPQLLKIRQLNPKIIILAYITSEEILDDVNGYGAATLRQEFASGLSDNWWLRDKSGNKISNWPYTSMFNLTDGAGFDAGGRRLNDYLPEFVADKIAGSGLWDGVFYDNTWGDISWLNNGNLDLNNDGVSDTPAQADAAWAAGFKKMLAKTRTLTGPNFIIIGNGHVYDGYQSIINGMMLESFPPPWENGGTWTEAMKTYLKLPSLNPAPAVSVVNVTDKNQSNYQHFRYGLASALLGNGFYSFDYNITNHGQTWWYDEYDVNLGPPSSPPFNLLANSSEELKPGLWRRDFKNGVAIVNSTDEKQAYVPLKEELEKISGGQAPTINNGAKINYIQLAARDGLILLKRNTAIKNSAFTNGYFYRVYNFQGAQISNGFFSYASAYPGEAEIITASGLNDATGDINLSAANGQLNLYQDGRRIALFYPYDKVYLKAVNLAAHLDEGYFKKIIIGAGLGGGPQVRIFSPSGRLEGSFFAYNKTLRGGVSVALADLDGDGQDEIITGPGKGDKSGIKIFTLSGQLKNTFLAYDAKFNGGINVAAGDVNGDGAIEIITIPASAGGPQIRVFTADGQALYSWFAYDQSYHGGARVSVSDINEDGQADILVGIKNFY
ncbi:MAG: putative glycoside hydrolase [Candidatus Falkowbacteria bacterium]|nr:putative glycoside hydrolase [Candidatus Falkowbacteria bacterium]